MNYKSRHALERRLPSAGLVTKPIGGLGKLDTGVWKLEVLTALRRPSCVEVVLVASTGHSHYERVTAWPRDLDPTASHCEGRVGLGPGFVLERNVQQYRGVDGQTKTPLTEWTESPASIYHDLAARGLAPATTELKEIRYADNDWSPISLAVAETCQASEGSSASSAFAGVPNSP